MTETWVVRAGQGSSIVDLFLERNLIAIGFSVRLGDRPLGASREELAAMLQEAHPSMPKGRMVSQSSQLYRFLSEMQVGDTVVTYDASQRRYHLGAVASEARYDASVHEGYRYLRDVQWTHRVRRDGLSVGTRNSLGSIMTLFRLRDEASEELRRNAVELDAPDQERSTPPNQAPDAGDSGTDGVDIDEVRESVVERASQFIEDMLDGLEPYEMQDLVAGILRAMGYKTRVAKPGPDRGIDIMASPDGLGLQEPRIFVEVKHRRNTAMSSQQLRTFLGGRQPGDRCLYVSTGGFTKDARYEAERSNVPLTLIDLPQLRELLVEHYEALDVETKQLVPLKRVFWPVGGD